MADETLFARLIVTDTGPLITLAAADSLDYLLCPGKTIESVGPTVDVMALPWLVRGRAMTGFAHIAP
jgi:hypothetical protein